MMTTLVFCDKNNSEEYKYSKTLEWFVDTKGINIDKIKEYKYIIDMTGYIKSVPERGFCRLESKINPEFYRFCNFRTDTSQETEYLKLLKRVLKHGYYSPDRTGVGVIKSETCEILSFDLHTVIKDGIYSTRLPLLTTKKMFFSGIVEELLWFLKGRTNSKELEEKGINIWKGNSSREFLDSRKLNYEEGELGPVYGQQWVNWGGDFITKDGGINQIENIINEIKTNPCSRRLVLNAWNVSELEKMALPPCHIMYIFNVNIKKNTLNCNLTLRSSDLFLGLPFNIASTAILTIIISKACGLIPGKIFFNIVDAHIYKTHVKQVEKQLQRYMYDFPVLIFKKDIKNYEDIKNLEFSDFVLKNYFCHSGLKAPMAV